MKKLLTLSFAACMFTMSTMAQVDKTTTVEPTKKADRQKGRGEGRGRMNDINLTPEQKAKMEALRQENKVKREQERAAQEAKMNEVLTPEQRAKREEMKKQRAERKNDKVKGREDHDGQEMEHQDKDDNHEKGEKGEKGKHDDNRNGDKHEKGKKGNHDDNRDGDKHKKGKKEKHDDDDKIETPVNPK
jgi:Spy/CpxP family protein refolding chaperone